MLFLDLTKFILRHRRFYPKNCSSCGEPLLLVGRAERNQMWDIWKCSYCKKIECLKEPALFKRREMHNGCNGEFEIVAFEEVEPVTRAYPGVIKIKEKCPKCETVRMLRLTCYEPK